MADTVGLVVLLSGSYGILQVCVKKKKPNKK